MPLRDYFQIIRKRGWIVILVTVLTVAAALVFSRVQTPVYRSTIYLNVWPARLDLGLQQTIKSLMHNYAGQISSRDNCFRVINRLELDITPEEMLEKITVSPVEVDFLIQIDADDYDPYIARDIAQTSAEIFVEDISAYMLDQDQRDRVEITIRDYALPGVLHKPKWKINALAGGVFGILIGVVIVFVIEYLQADVIRSSQDIEQFTGAVVLGTIPSGDQTGPLPTNAGRRQRRT